MQSKLTGQPGVSLITRDKTALSILEMDFLKWTKGTPVGSIKLFQYMQSKLTGQPGVSLITRDKTALSMLQMDFLKWTKGTPVGSITLVHLVFCWFSFQNTFSR